MCVCERITISLVAISNKDKRHFRALLWLFVSSGCQEGDVHGSRRAGDRLLRIWQWLVSRRALADKRDTMARVIGSTHELSTTNGFRTKITSCEVQTTTGLSLLASSPFASVARCILSRHVSLSLLLLASRVVRCFLIERILERWKDASWLLQC